MLDEFVTTDEAARILGFSTSYVNRLVRLKRLKAERKGGVHLIRRADLENIAPAPRPRGRPRQEQE